MEERKIGLILPRAPKFPQTGLDTVIRWFRKIFG